MSKCLRLSIRRELVSRKPIGILKRYETSCLTRKNKQDSGGDVWNSEQPLPVANASSLFFRERASASFASKFLAGRATAFSTDRKSTRLNSSHIPLSRMPSSA